MINLEKILLSKLTTETMLANNPDYTYVKVLEAMKESCDKTIDLCIESIVDEEDKELQQCVESIRDNLLALKKEII